MDEDWGFMRAADLARTCDEGFELGRIREIEAAWQIADLDHGSFGFILAMTDGRRLYWRYTSDDPDAGRIEDLEETELAASERPPGNWYRPDRLNRHLEVLQRFK